MIVDLDVLKKCGIDYESLKKTFQIGKKGEYTVDDETRRGKLKKLKDLIKSRVSEGRSWNLTNHRQYKAIDDAWDTPLKQITVTMLMNLIDSDSSLESKMSVLKGWGVDPADVMTEMPDPKTPGKTLKRVSIPALYRVFVPLIQPYVTIRQAKIMNDRRLVPFFKYEPAISDKINRTRCEVVTQRIEVMSTQYGLYDIVKQAVLRMLIYGECLQFPVEAWDTNYSIAGKDSSYKGEFVNSKGETVKEDSKECVGKKVIVKEGIRYHLPHPTRTFYDRAWFPSTFNSDSGATYAGYWRIVRFREMADNKDFYNLDRVSIGDTKWYELNSAFFANIYPCTLKFPPPMEDQSGKSKWDSEAHVGAAWYTTDMGDMGAMQTNFFMKLVPSEWGMGDYDFPVWFRFVVAGDDTIIYCCPLPYAPVVYYGYDSFEGRTMQTSMAMEIMPHQDHFSNLMSQYLLTSKQNLFNLTLVDTDILDEAEVKTMESWSQRLFSSLNLKRFSMKKLGKLFGGGGGGNVRALYAEKLPQMDTNAILAAMRVVIEVLERVLGMSSQELGQAASHEQTAEELRNIKSNTTMRQQYTASAVDIAREAMKRQLYEGLMAYGDAEFYAQVAADPEITEELLDKHGFTVQMEDKRSKKRVIKTKDKTAIQVVSFASARDGDDRINNTQMATAMGGWMVQMLANPMMAQAIGPEQAIQLANMVGRLSGFPREFKLMNRGPDKTPEEQNAAIMQQVQQFVQEAMGSIQKDIQGALTPIMDENHAQTAQIQQLAQQTAQLTQEVQVIEQSLQQPPQQPQMMAPPPMMAPNASVATGQVPVVNPAVMNDLAA